MAKPNVAHAMALIAWQKSDPATRGECPLHPQSIGRRGLQGPVPRNVSGSPSAMAWAESGNRLISIKRQEEGWTGPSPETVAKNAARQDRRRRARGE
jgi:hypothetical protein